MKSSLVLLPLLATLSLARPVPGADSLRSGFLQPPESAKPQTWWHWMNGNITKAGITADLEAMKRIGLGGATIVNVDCGIPAGPVAFMSPEWRKDFKFAVEEAKRLGLGLTVANCAGWSESGGPWITPENAMQGLTSSETKVHGPATFDDKLPPPPVNLGFYRDVAVVAFKAPPAKDDKPRPAGKLEIKRATYKSCTGTGGLDVTSNIVNRIQHGQEAVNVNTGEMGGDPAPGEYKELKLEFTLGGEPGTLTIKENKNLTFPVNSRQLEAARKWEETAVNATFVRPPPSPDVGKEAISYSGVVDLTDKLDADGKLRWDVPPGEWIILRFGHTPIGVNNHPAPKGGEGLECDKLSKAALDAHWNGFMRQVLDDIGPLAGTALRGSLIDSYEMGNQDWTPNFRAEFKKRRGYDPLKFLPTFTHQVVDSPEVTERFLWDMRRTVADLFAENYFGHFAELCHERGLSAEVEPYTGPFESLQSGATADVVLGEFWVNAPVQPAVRMAASIAHIYGKGIVGAESFTATASDGRWQNDPYSLKALGDLLFCQGLNRYIFHRYAMQPWLNRWPGMTMGEWGFHFERTLTWWTQGKPWIEYISRCQFLLQQGRAVSDVAYFTGETAPVQMRTGNPPPPAGYNYDAVNANVLRNGATVRNGRIVLKSGASYAALVLPADDANITPETLKCLRDLVNAGATVIGQPPPHSPSLAGYPSCDAQVKKMAAEMWGQINGTTIKENVLGSGRVIWGKSLEEVFAAQRLEPDFAFKGADTGTQLAYFHRLAGDTDIYFVSNQRRQFDTAECTFRVRGKIPELGNPDTGEIRPAPIWREEDGRTTVRLDFHPAGSTFVIFRPGKVAPTQLVAARSNIPDTAARRPKLEIKRAVYTASDGTGTLDVTDTVSKLVKDDSLVAEVVTGVMGGDPAPFHVKELRLDYILGGRAGHALVVEGGTLRLANVGQPPRWEATIAEDGSPAVKLWTNGQVDLRTADGSTLRATATGLPAPQEIAGSWTLNFPPNWGAPESVKLDELASWTDNSDAGVRYFSGSATYGKEITIPAERLVAGRELWLDLGDVRNFAEVSLNGHDFGVLWNPPFRVNITAAAKPGANQLTVKVTNLWPNRLIGDDHLPPDCEWNGAALATWPQWLLEGKPSPTGRFTFTTWRHYTKDSPLLPSGLLGPVTLETAEIVAPTPDGATPQN